ncbi:Flagellar assembly protein FliH/Type III secretion system HrpE [Gemmatirosa kalamazoonensis]|uniref:Flagellar assembly protein FliH n=2 Tax=Gemmatirosa kalamazoonensis TaxID=861299 RepID=W0R9G1_9BACT|nr:Flagellar assembly protein FliH/Type III secretion system HrpE [Gemmatirosa kalamazoonensis]
MPEQIPVEAFELPELEMPELEPTYDADTPVTARDLEDAVRAALARREEEALVEREQLQADAYAAGVAQGRAEAQEAGRLALASALEALWLAAEAVREGEARWLGTLQDNVAALASAAARVVVGREVRDDDGLVRDLAARATAEFPQDQSLQVRVHPSDLDTLKSTLTESRRAGEVRWIPDPRVERGGVVVEGRERIVDGRVDTALERVYRRLSGHHA